MRQDVEEASETKQQARMESLTERLMGEEAKRLDGYTAFVDGSSQFHEDRNIGERPELFDKMCKETAKVCGGRDPAALLHWDSSLSTKSCLFNEEATRAQVDPKYIQGVTCRSAVNALFEEIGLKPPYGPINNDSNSSDGCSASASTSPAQLQRKRQRVEE